MIETLLQDVRYGLRMLAKSPGFVVIAVLSLGLGIGANSAIFSLVNTVALRPLPVEKPEQLVSLQNVSSTRVSNTFSYLNYKDFRARNDVFSGLVGYRFAPLSVSHDGINEKLWGYIVTGNYFDVLGVKPAIGRVILPEDDREVGGHPVTVIGYQCWQQRFGGDPSVIGKSLIVNGRSYSVIGVAPKGFFGTEVIAAPELWFPMSMQAEVELVSGMLDKRSVEFIILQGRLKPGVTISRAQAMLNSVASQLETEFPDDNQGKRVALQSTSAGSIAGPFMDALLGFAGMLMVVVTLVLILACTNLANLMLARAAERRKEIAVRLALGASRTRLVFQLLSESVMLSIVSGVSGLFLAYWLVRLFSAIKVPVDFPILIELHLDYRVLIFTCLTALGTGILFGLLPALQTTKVDLLTALKDESSSGSYRRSWWKSSLIVTQIALSMVLLVGGGLMLKALQRTQTINLGFDPHNAVEVSFDLRLQGYDSGHGLEFQKSLVERVRSMPGVQSAGISDMAPVDLHFPRGPIFIEGQLPERNATAPRAMINRISPGYLRSLGSRIVAGRDFAETDDDKAPGVAIVNETLARRFWPGQDALGKRLSVAGPNQMLTIVGVVEDGKYDGLGDDTPPYVCRPMLQSYSGSTTLIARGGGDPRKLLTLIRAELQQQDSHLPIFRAEPLAEKMSLPLLPARVAAMLLVGFGSLALVLSAIGIYGVMSYAVSRRTQEIGVRMALGAEAADVLKFAIADGLTPTLMGIGIGLAVAMALTQSIKSVLFGVSATDPLTYVVVTVLLVAVALIACYIPARRATRIDPMVALRYK